MRDDISFKKSKIYYFPTIRNFGLIKKIENGVIYLMSPFSNNGLKNIAKIDSKEPSFTLSFVNRDGILLIDGQMLKNTSSGEMYICNVSEDKKFKIRKLKTSNSVDVVEVSKMIKEEKNGNTSNIETVYKFDGNFEEELTVDLITSIFSYLGDGTGNIELSDNIYQIVA